MSTQKIKLIRPTGKEVKHTHRDNWEAMKPFVHFSVKALSVIGLGLIAIIKALPMLKSHGNSNTSLKRR